MSKHVMQPVNFQEPSPTCASGYRNLLEKNKIDVWASYLRDKKNVVFFFSFLEHLPPMWIAITCQKQSSLNSWVLPSFTLQVWSV